MIRFWNLLLVVVTPFIPVNAQERFYLIEDFGHLQAKGYSIEEHDSHLYVIGMAIAESDSIYEENIHITKYDLEGNHIKSIFFDNDRNRGSLNLVMDQAVSIYQNQLVITVNIGANIHDAIILVDKDLDEAKLVAYYTLGLGDEIGVIARAHHLTEDNKLVFPMTSNAYKNFIGYYELETDIFQYYDHSADPEYGYYPSKILPLANDNLLIIGAVSIKGADGSYLTGSRTTYFTKLDKALNKISENYLYNPNYGGIADNIHAIKKSNDEIIITVKEEDKDSAGRFNDRHRPKILGINPHTGEVLWENNLADAVFKKRFDFPQSLIFSHDSTAYITVGLKYEDPNNGGSQIATIQKVDSLGNNLWYKCIADEYDGSELILYDVIATSDGHYTACGYRSDRSDNDGYDSRTQQFLIKFDEEGRIVDRLSATKETDNSKQGQYIKVFPNPSQGLVTIENQTQQSYSYELYDSAGKLLEKIEDSTEIDIYIMSTVSYSPGNYYLKVINNKGVVLQVEKLVLVQ